MKKLIVITLLLFCGGCYNYQELNNLAIVSGMGIDYDGNEYVLSLELLNTESEKNDSQASGYLVTGKGDSISLAFSDATAKIKKVPYLNHLKVLVLNEKILEEELGNVVDYFLRNLDVHNEFYLVAANGTTAEKIFSASSELTPVVSQSIVSLLESSKFNNNLAVPMTFETILDKAMNEGDDFILSSVDDGLELGEVAAFKDFNLQGYLEKDMVSNYNLLANNNSNMILMIPCSTNSSKHLVTKVVNSKSKIMALNKKIEVFVSVSIDIVENNCNYDISKKQLESSFEGKLAIGIKELVEKSYLLNSDFLGLGDTYYKMYKKKKDLQQLNYEIDVVLDINTGVLIQGVNYDS